MNEKDFIYKLLEKENISDDENSQMNEILNKDRSLKSFVNFYFKAKAAVEKKSHIAPDILADYILFKSQLQTESAGIFNLADKIENHLRGCDKCTEDFKVLNEEYLSVDEFITDNISQTDINETEITKNVFKNIFQSRTVYKSLYAFALLVLFYAGAVFITNYSIPDYNREITELSGELNLNSRGRASQEFLMGISELQKGNFENAVLSFKSDLKNNKNSKTIFYTHFILGQAYLRNAKKDLLGINLGFDQDFINKSINEFRNCIAVNNNYQFVNINYDAHYFVGRAYLLRDDKNQAIEEFNKVIENKGRFINEAKELISTIKSE
ncbi:MAG: hypothetical protein HND52_19165 [Ignavibacteriae bacterium]|nr:hypothetical protein [Ignavibacteriota bacterium]NOH00087.1 hypothetical protein [Ignavibacteriota bacterium]